MLRRVFPAVAAAAAAAAAGAPPVPTPAPPPGIKYRAAVVEVSPTMPALRGENATLESAREVMRRNVDIARALTAKAAAAGAQIVVFPEDFATSGGMLGPADAPLYGEALPEPGPASLCTAGESATPIAQALACVARQFGVVLVTGLADKGPCVSVVSPFTRKPYPCDRATNLTQFNSQAAFGRDGALLAKYHKGHLARSINSFEEPWAQPAVPEVVTFDTHFGVKFGMLICMDSNFGGPALGLRRAGARDFVFSTWWWWTGISMGLDASVSDYTPNGWQDAFARAHGVNFLAANAHGTWGDNSGSGIFPANTSAPFIQHLEYGPTAPEGWLGVADVVSPAASPVPADVPQARRDAKQVCDNGTADAQLVYTVPGKKVHASLQVDDITCTVDGEVASGGGYYVFYAYAGLSDMGTYQAICKFQAVVGTIKVLKEEPGPYPWDGCPTEREVVDMPTYGSAAVWSALRLAAEPRDAAPRLNVVFPFAECTGGLVPSPRSALDVSSTSDAGGRVLALATGCPVQLLMTDARPQSEGEQPRCPGDGSGACSNVTRAGRALTTRR